MNCSRKGCPQPATMDSPPDHPLCTKHNRALLKKSGVKLLARQTRPAPGEGGCQRCGGALKPDVRPYLYAVGDNSVPVCPPCWKQLTAR